MNSIKVHIPGSLITLFDHTLDTQIKGVMFFSETPKNNDSSIDKEPKSSKYKENALWLKDRYKKQTKTQIITLKGLAFTCLVFAVIGFINLILPVAIAETRLRIDYFKANFSQINVSAQVASNKPIPTPFNNAFQYIVDSNKTEQATSQEFNISIPKINLTSDVVPNVDPNVDTIYKESLKVGVAHAKGSYLPGEKGTVFLFAHSTDTPAHILEYNAKFYAVKDLQAGDEIDIDYHGKHYSYTIYDNKITTPFDLDTIRNSHADLILQTCWPPGTDWQRLMVFAKQNQ